MLGELAALLGSDTVSSSLTFHLNYSAQEFGWAFQQKKIQTYTRAKQTDVKTVAKTSEGEIKFRVTN